MKRYRPVFIFLGALSVCSIACCQSVANLNYDGTSGNAGLQHSAHRKASTPDLTDSLPSILASFIARPNDVSVILHWTTLQEENFDHFEIQRSFDGIDFQTIGIETGARSSTKKTSYMYLDSRPIYGKSYYRLNAVGHDGSQRYLDRVIVKFGIDQLGVRIYANANYARNVKLTLNYLLTPWQQDVVVYDMNGSVVFHSTEKNHTILVPMDQQQPGIYILKVRIDNAVLTQKFTIR